MDDPHGRQLPYHPGAAAAAGRTPDPPRRPALRRSPRSPIGPPPEHPYGPAGGSGGRYRPADDPSVLAYLAGTGEAELFEEFDGRAEQEAAGGFAAGGHLGDGLDAAAAGVGDLVESAFQRRPRDAMAAMPLVDVEAGDPPVRAR